MIELAAFLEGHPFTLFSSHSVIDAQPDLEIEETLVA